VEKNDKAVASKQGLPEATIQVLAWIALFGMFMVDKVMHIVVPPLDDVYYGIAAGVAVFGHGVGKVLAAWRGKS